MHLKQMSLPLDLPPIDEVETRKAVEAELERALLYKTIDFEEREATITGSYQERFHGPTNVTSDQTANVAIHNVDALEHRRRHVDRVEKAVSRLAPKERQLITERYLVDPYRYDTDVYYGIMGISAKTYIKIRERAFYKLAFILKVEVVKQSGQNTRFE